MAYRVQQLVASDVDIQEGPLLPSPDWVEQEILLSSCGWIEVHKDCLVSARLFPALSDTLAGDKSTLALWLHLSFLSYGSA